MIFFFGVSRCGCFKCVRIVCFRCSSAVLCCFACFSSWCGGKVFVGPVFLRIFLGGGGGAHSVRFLLLPFVLRGSAHPCSMWQSIGALSAIDSSTSFSVCYIMMGLFSSAGLDFCLRLFILLCSLFSLRGAYRWRAALCSSLSPSILPSRCLTGGKLLFDFLRVFWEGLCPHFHLAFRCHLSLSIDAVFV